MTQVHPGIPSPERIMLPLLLEEGYQSERQQWNAGDYAYDFVQLPVPAAIGKEEFANNGTDSGLSQAVDMLNKVTQVNLYGPKSKVLPVVAMFAPDGQVAFYDVRKNGGVTLHLLQEEGAGYRYTGRQECSDESIFILYGGTNLLFGAKTKRPRKERNHDSEGQEPAAYTVYKELVDTVAGNTRRRFGRKVLQLPSHADGSHDIV